MRKRLIVLICLNGTETEDSTLGICLLCTSLKRLFVSCFMFVFVTVRNVFDLINFMFLFRYVCVTFALL